jgi:NAD(P)-dependent dehydrogenase (short-subunit alcohol dehydrogenase family)
MFGLPAGAFRLDGKTAVVTGASRNIGLSLSLGFAQAGADVVMVSRGGEQLARAAAAVAAAVPGRDIRHCAADVGTAGGAAKVIGYLRSEAGAVDILVNGAYSSGKAGLPPGLGMLEIPDATWQVSFDTNVMGPYRLISGLFGERAKTGGTGSVINFLSGSGFLPVPEPTNCPYGATKSALWMMTRYMAHHLAPNIRVNAICPGNVTPDGTPNNDVAARLLPSIPMGRIGRPREITGAAVYLASEAASYTTGEVIFCNGGRPW